jgi:hypothetical protein
MRAWSRSIDREFIKTMWGSRSVMLRCPMLFLWFDHTRIDVWLERQLAAKLTHVATLIFAE